MVSLLYVVCQTLLTVWIVLVELCSEQPPNHHLHPHSTDFIPMIELEPFDYDDEHDNQNNR
jgi:hypothetical protein